MVELMIYVNYVNSAKIWTRHSSMFYAQIAYWDTLHDSQRILERSIDRKHLSIREEHESQCIDHQWTVIPRSIFLRTINVRRGW